MARRKRPTNNAPRQAIRELGGMTAAAARLHRPRQRLSAWCRAGKVANSESLLQLAMALGVDVPLRLLELAGFTVNPPNTQRSFP